jgi:DNA topoisomerase-2
MSDIESENGTSRKIKQLSPLQFMRQSTAWCGSKKIQEIELFAYDKKTKRFALETLKFPPALLKLFDEIIVNAIDHQSNHPKLVNELRITFDKKTGEISIFNNGPGISIEETENVNKVKMHIPTMICSELHSGSNFEDTADKISAGCNGIGAKLVNTHSSYFIIETVDTKRKLKFTQKFEDRLEKIHDPVIEKTKEPGHTKITFLPSYDVFGYKNGYSVKRDGSSLDKLFETRTLQAAGFVSCKVYYNEELVSICTLESEKGAALDATESKKKPRGLVKNSSFKRLVELFLEDEQPYESIILKPDLKDLKATKEDSKKLKTKGSKEAYDSDADKKTAHPMEIHIAISDGKFRQFSLINGLYLVEGGNHITYLQKQIVEALKPKVEKLIKKSQIKFNANFILNNIMLFTKGVVAGLDLNGGNIKNFLSNPIDYFSSLTFTTNDINKIWSLLEDSITLQFLNKVGDKKKTKVTRGQIIIKKADDARYAGHKTKWQECSLFIAEGDSALATVREGILNKTTELSMDYYGTFNILGVPMNCRKEVDLIKDPKTGEYRVIRKDKLQKNERLTALVKMLGLDYEKKYATNPAGEEEFGTLRYGRCIIATDADVDGAGQIGGLLLNFFVLFWPNLVKRGFVSRLNTPIIRAYPRNIKKYIKEFYTDKQYRTWIQSEFEGDDSLANKTYDIRYYKGLGTHEKHEIPQLFKNFESKLFIYQLDSKAIETMEIYFGKETAPRKRVLATPPASEEPEGPEVNTSDFLNVDVKAFQRDNISRKIPHVYDGQVPSRRKVLCAARAEFSRSNSRIKVNALTNIVSKEMEYHHGEQSLSTTIIKMCQSFIGARNFPFLYPRGQFGTRALGKDFASPRYIYTNLNKRLCMAMFPPVDDYLLPYVFDEGKRCEPIYYLPILPLAVLESCELPATGWKIKIWAREIMSVIAEVEKLISREHKKCEPLPIWNTSPGCEIRKYKGKQYAFGKYTYDAKSHNLVVTALPLGVFSCQIAGSEQDDGGMRPEFRAKPCDETSDTEVKITFYFKPDAVKEIKKTYGNSEIDWAEDYLNLKNSLDENINMINGEGKIIEFKTYNDVVDQWFKARSELYIERIDRETILTNLRILFLKNVIRFIKNHLKYEINPKKKRGDVDNILAKAKYDTFNKTLLFSPKYTKAADLEHLIINNPDAGTSYDYLVDLKYSDLLEESCAKKEEELKKEMQKLKDLEDDAGDETFIKGAKTWIKELNELTNIIKLGLEKGWDYGEKLAKFSD